MTNNILFIVHFVYLMIFFSHLYEFRTQLGERQLLFPWVERGHPPEMVEVLRTEGIPEATYIPVGLAPYGNVAHGAI